MGVVLIAGGIAVTAQRAKSGSGPIAPAAAIAPQTVTPQTVIPQATVPATVPQTALQVEASASALAAEPTDTWVVQVAAFSSQDRSLAMVERLTQSGFPAFEVPSSGGAQGPLYFVRVGPFKTAADADEARTKLGQLAELDGAFVRSVTTRP
jgi:cell division septation protein DedD